MTKAERLERQRIQRAKNNNHHTKKYEKTHKGFLMRLYRNMKSRISGVQKQKYHLYEGKELFDKDEFYSWALQQPSFYILFDAYVAANYDRKLAPSIDRVDSSKGYTFNNVEWVTMLENSIRGNKSRYAAKSISNS
jgi:hypothetical protein